MVLVASVLASTAAPAGAQAILCNGLVATIVGTPGPDVLTGTDGDDVIASLGGNDRVLAGKGNDTVCTGPGNDWAKGQQGADDLFMGAGRDIAFGNAGPDNLLGGSGNDILWGGVGPDGIWAGDGNDVIHAGHGNDIAVGGRGNDKLNGSTGADEMWGGQGADVMTGGKGFDELFGQAGADLITGGPGDDFIDGGLGVDRCRIRIHDVFIECQGGNITGDSGLGDGEFVPTLNDDFALPSGGGDVYILHVDAQPVAGQVLTVQVKDANGGLLFEGGGFDPVFSNVMIAGGVPAMVEIRGAEFWHTSFIKPSILFDNLIRNVDQGSQVFGVAPSLDGFPQPVNIVAENQGNTNSIFQLVSIGDVGIVLELDETIAPGQTREFGGDLRVGTTHVAILSGQVAWEFELTNG